MLTSFIVLLAKAGGVEGGITTDGEAGKSKLAETFRQALAIIIKNLNMKPHHLRGIRSTKHCMQSRHDSANLATHNQLLAHAVPQHISIIPGV
jgi:hypothetical protein